MLEIIRKGIFGLAVADAIGVPAEFCSREMLKERPICDMVGYGTHHQPKGTWSDDTSMALCLAVSLTEKQGFDPDDVMKRFADWLKKGAYTPHGKCFDCGNTVYNAVQRYSAGTPALECGGRGEYDNGNGSLMRILPLVFPLVKQYGSRLWEHDAAMQMIHAASSLTHGHEISLSACGVYLCVAAQLIAGQTIKDSVRLGTIGALQWYQNHDFYADAMKLWTEFCEPERFRQREEESIKSSGFVVHTLEAALWCLLNTGDYESCVLKAVNLGSDTDTVAAVAGGLAGLAYGFGGKGIPDKWMSSLQAVRLQRCWKRPVRNCRNKSIYNEETALQIAGLFASQRRRAA